MSSQAKGHATRGSGCSGAEPERAGWSGKDHAAVFEQVGRVGRDQVGDELLEFLELKYAVTILVAVQENGDEARAEAALRLFEEVQAP